MGAVRFVESFEGRRFDFRYMDVEKGGKWNGIEWSRWLGEMCMYSVVKSFVLV